MKVLAVFTSLVLAFSLTACQRPVAKDYPKYLEKNVGESQLPTTNKANNYFLPPETKSFRYEFRSFMAGPANTWIVDFGKMLDDTLKSKDVQAAFGNLKAVDSASAPGKTLIFELRDYRFEEFGAHISLNIKLTNAGATLFEKDYTQSGKTQGGKMFWGGEYAQKNAVQQSTKLAMDEILRQLIADLNSQK